MFEHHGLPGLERWYQSHCNDDWEHQYGITIETLDNPGWKVKIDLKGTKAEKRTLDWVKVDRSENNWIHYRVKKFQFELACGALNLSEGLDIFLDWFDGSN